MNYGKVGITCVCWVGDYCLNSRWFIHGSRGTYWDICVFWGLGHFEQIQSRTHRIHGAGIYANIGGILMGSMLPYIAAPWILWGMQMAKVATGGRFWQKSVYPVWDNPRIYPINMVIFHQGWNSKLECYGNMDIPWNTYISKTHICIYIYWLVVWNIFIFPYIGNVILPTDVHDFSEGWRKTTNQ